jgi:hypothetical protein
MYRAKTATAPCSQLLIKSNPSSSTSPGLLLFGPNLSPPFFLLPLLSFHHTFAHSTLLSSPFTLRPTRRTLFPFLSILFIGNNIFLVQAPEHLTLVPIRPISGLFGPDDGFSFPTPILTLLDARLRNACSLAPLPIEF